MRSSSASAIGSIQRSRTPTCRRLSRSHRHPSAENRKDAFDVGATVLRGRISADQMKAAADLADRFADGHLRTTNMQNLLIINVPKQNTDALAKELAAIELPVAGSPSSAALWRALARVLQTRHHRNQKLLTVAGGRTDERLPGFDQDLNLHVTGCPNSCGQHWIADLGIEGKKMKVDGQSVDAYYFCVGDLAAHMRPWRDQWAIAAQRWRFRMRLNACCNDFITSEVPAKICAGSSIAIATPSYATFWPGRSSNQSSATRAGPIPTWIGGLSHE